jgi:gamma-soluble NSF attachment protein
MSSTQNLSDPKFVSGIQAYLSAIIIYLYAHDFQQAQKCYNDCSE